MINLLQPQKQMISIEFHPQLWGKLLIFWQRKAQRLEELSGIQRHWVIPLFGNPSMDHHQWRSVQQVLKLAAKSNPKQRNWMCEAAWEIDKALGIAVK
jgi:hypothetical protein